MAETYGVGEVEIRALSGRGSTASSIRGFLRDGRVLLGEGSPVSEVPGTALIETTLNEERDRLSIRSGCVEVEVDAVGRDVEESNRQPQDAAVDVGGWQLAEGTEIRFSDGTYAGVVTNSVRRHVPLEARGTERCHPWGLGSGPSVTLCADAEAYRMMDDASALDPEEVRLRRRERGNLEVTSVTGVRAGEVVAVELQRRLRRLGRCVSSSTVEIEAVISSDGELIVRSLDPTVEDDTAECLRDQFQMVRFPPEEGLTAIRLRWSEGE